MRETMQDGVLPFWQHFWQHAADFLPNALASLLVLVVGASLGVVIGRVARKICKMTDIDGYAAKMGVAASLEAVGIRSTGRLLAGVLQWLVILSSTIVAMYLLDPRLASGLAERFLLYVPQILGAALILLGGIIAARFLSRSVLIAAVNRGLGPSRLLSDLTRVAVVTIAVAIAFEQAQIGRTTVLVAFTILFGGVTLAASIALGFALRELATRWLLQQFDAQSTDRDRDAFHHW